MSNASQTPTKVTLLVLGAGWTYQFLKPLLDESPSVTYAATTTTGRDHTIAFGFDPESNDLEPFKRLPLADYVLVTFPLKGRGVSAKLVKMYIETHPVAPSTDELQQVRENTATKWIQLGSTGIFTASNWNDNHSPIDLKNERGIAEDELISLGGCVLNLAGLYGAQRQPSNWIARVAKTKEQLAEKGALHLIHGADVARAVLAVVNQEGIGPEDNESSDKRSRLFGRRWIIADCVSYDWWSIVWELNGDSGEEHVGEAPVTSEESKRYRQWVAELMQEHGIKALPRPPEALGRKLDAREFWAAIGMLPGRTLRR